MQLHRLGFLLPCSLMVVSLHTRGQVAKPRPQLLVGLDAKTVIPLCRQLPNWLSEGLTTTFGFWKMPALAALK